MLRLPRALRDELIAQARTHAPEEACGLLAGRRVGDVHEVSRVFLIPNASPRPSVEFLLEPVAQLRATLQAEDELGLDVLGPYHTHPEGPARFSATDVARATWTDASHVLVHLKPSEGITSARWDGARFLDEAIDIT